MDIGGGKLIFVYPCDYEIPSSFVLSRYRVNFMLMTIRLSSLVICGRMDEGAKES